MSVTVKRLTIISGCCALNLAKKRGLSQQLEIVNVLPFSQQTNYSFLG